MKSRPVPAATNGHTKSFRTLRLRALFARRTRTSKDRLLTSLESTLPNTRESVSKQTTLTLLESALTNLYSFHPKQRTSSPSESILTQFVTVSPLESALPKKMGGATVCFVKR